MIVTVVTLIIVKQLDTLTINEMFSVTFIIVTEVILKVVLWTVVI